MYRIWSDELGGYKSKRFATLQEAIDYALVTRGTYHQNRIDLDGNTVYIVSPFFYWGDEHFPPAEPFLPSAYYASFEI